MNDEHYNYHSGWSDGDLAYCGIGTALYRVNPGGTVTGVRSGLTGDRIEFSRVADRVYYSNGTQDGYIVAATSTARTVQNYVGPTTMTQFSVAPKAKCLAVFNSRMYLSSVADPDVMTWSEPGEVDLFNLLNYKRFEGEIRMFAPVDSGVGGGIFVSTDKATYFVTGAPNVTLKQVAAYPAYVGSVAQRKYACRKLGIDMDGDAVIWRAKTGLCAGLPTGSMINLTDDMVAVGTECGDSGATLIVGDQCIHTTGSRTLITNLAVGNAGRGESDDATD